VWCGASVGGDDRVSGVGDFEMEFEMILVGAKTVSARRSDFIDNLDMASSVTLSTAVCYDVQIFYMPFRMQLNSYPSSILT
jgi:hypothetical protein